MSFSLPSVPSFYKGMIAYWGYHEMRINHGEIEKLRITRQLLFEAAEHEKRYVRETGVQFPRSKERGIGYDL